jgi:biofilm PGA synthesis N-glycosyltransferase PgaC
MAFALVITTLTLLLYSVVILLLLHGFRGLKSPVHEQPVNKEKVTVVIPFRNEAGQLQALIGDLLRQTCPGDLFSVILVNDHSTDGSPALVRSLISDRAGFSCLDLPDGMNGKKAALLYANSHAETRWIIQTDADCRMEPGFIGAHMGFLEENPSDLVAGLVTTRKGSGGFLEAFERLDLLGLAGAGAGSFFYGRPMMCSGANLLYSKELYMETRGYDPVEKSASGDDMFLLIGARRLGRKLSFNPGRSSMARTKTTPEAATLVRQRMRWGSKSAYYGMADIQLLTLLVAMTTMVVLLSPLWMLLFPGSFRWFLPAVAIKTFVDFLMLTAVTGTTGQRATLRWFLPVSILYYPYMLVVITGSLFGRSHWK